MLLVCGGVLTVVNILCHILRWLSFVLCVIFRFCLHFDIMEYFFGIYCRTMRVELLWIWDNCDGCGWIMEVLRNVTKFPLYVPLL